MTCHNLKATCRRHTPEICNAHKMEKGDFLKKSIRNCSKTMRENMHRKGQEILHLTGEERLQRKAQRKKRLAGDASRYLLRHCRPHLETSDSSSHRCHSWHRSQTSGTLRRHSLAVMKRRRLESTPGNCYMLLTGSRSILQTKHSWSQTEIIPTVAHITTKHSLSVSLTLPYDLPPSLMSSPWPRSLSRGLSATLFLCLV